MSRWVWREFRRSRRSAQRPRKTSGFAFSDSRLEERTMLSLVTGVVPTINQVGGSPTTTNLTAVGDKLFFITPSSSPGTETLWASGGGTSGAVALASIASPNAGPPSNSPPFVAQSGNVYFISADNASSSSQYFATVPGNYALNLRRLYLLNTNYADLSFLFTILPGEKTNPYLGTECLAIVETDNSTPYFLNLHAGVRAQRSAHPFPRRHGPIPYLLLR